MRSRRVSCLDQRHFSQEVLSRERAARVTDRRMAIVKQETHFVLGGDPVKGEVRPFVVFANVLIARNDARLIVAYIALLPVDIHPLTAYNLTSSAKLIFAITSRAGLGVVKSFIKRTILPRRHRGHGEELRRERMPFVSGTVEILFRTHTDAPRGCSKYLYPGGMQVTGYGRLPISGQS